MIERKLNLVVRWLWLRKNTTPVHWTYGLACSFLIYAFGILAGWGMMGVFAGMEVWNDKCDGTNQGYKDWWESFATFFPGQCVLALLSCLAIITIRWY
jgi:hypothetical protein